MHYDFNTDLHENLMVTSETMRHSVWRLTLINFHPSSSKICAMSSWNGRSMCGDNRPSQRCLLRVSRRRYSPTPCHYATPKVGRLPQVVCPVTCPQSNAPSRFLSPWLMPTLNCQEATSRISVSHSDLHFCSPLRDMDTRLVSAVIVWALTKVQV